MQLASQHGVAYDVPGARAAATRGARGATIASWNAEKKLSPHDWGAWTNILRRVPSARLQQHIARPGSAEERRLASETAAAEA